MHKHNDILISHSINKQITAFLQRTIKFSTGRHKMAAPIEQITTYVTDRKIMLATCGDLDTIGILAYNTL